MTTEISILCDNTASTGDFLEEHGFSAMIERDGQKFLFDTGQGLTLPNNLTAAGKDLKSIERIFLSHGHYDHTGGLKWVLETGGPQKIAAHADLFTEHLSLRPGKGEPGKPRYIGCPFSRRELQNLGARFTFFSKTEEVSPGIRFVCGVDRQPSQVPDDRFLVLSQNGAIVPDPMADDASLLMETADGPILLLGCSHAGVLNILDHVRKVMGIARLRAVLGGTHLMFLPPEEIPKVIAGIETFSVDLVAVSHCTGMRAARSLADHFGDRFAFASVGTVFRF